MSLLAALVLATTTARVEAVTFGTVEARLAVRVAVAGEPGPVAVHRDGEGARISVGGTRLGGRFAGGSRFAWAPARRDAAPAASAGLERIEVAASPDDVTVLLQVPPEVSIDVRRDPEGLLLLLLPGAGAPPPRAPPVTVAREPVHVAARPETVASAGVEPAPQAPEPADEEPSPEPPAPAPEVEPQSPPSPGTAELARGLFPAEAGAATEGQASVRDLYGQLFPGGPPQTAPETTEPDGEPLATSAGVPFGPFRVRGGVDARYVDADTYIEGPNSRTRARYLEVAPRVAAEAPLADGRLSLEYRPFLRAFSDIEEVNSSSHHARAGLDLPLGPSVVARVRDTFISGVLDTREADPGGEYFFQLGRFHRNTFEGGLSVLVNPRLSLELDAGARALRFQEESSFFDYDTRFASAGLGYELTPTLKTTLRYAYDTVPTPEERPEAARTAHNAQLTFTGDVLPLVTGRLMVGYRDQRSPNAGEGGTRYTGFIMGGSLTKQVSHESDVTLLVNRSTPVSAFEDNAFYVFTGIQGTGRFPLPLGFQLRVGLGYQWNDYRTLAQGAGEPRQDRILGYHLGLRRSVVRHLFLSAVYRREERRSNLERFDTDSDGFFIQLEWDIFGYPP
jgi:hypothetical protein